MTTWYIDPINGTNSSASAGNGDSFAARRKTIDNLVATATAPGDTAKIMASPDPTSLGVTGVWTAGPYSDTVTPASSTNATPIVITLSSGNYTTLAPAVNDTVIVNGHTTNTNANGVWIVSAVNGSTTLTIVNADGTNSVGNGAGGISGNVRKITNGVVTLASALTKNVALTGNRGTKTNWTASANVTNTINTTDYKEGGECQQIVIAAGFTTGLAAYYPLGASTDYSGYQQLTFWIKQTAGTVGAAGAVQIKLCSDTAGATAVDTIDIPAMPGLNKWMPVTIDKSAALGSSIQSVAFYVVTDNGTQTFLLDNIQTSKASSSADSLSLQSLIGKNTGTETFYAIQSINDKRIMLDQDVSFIPATTPARGYFGTTETVTTYKRETTKVTTGYTINESGTDGNLIMYSGGWNTTDMSTQTGETWLDACMLASVNAISSSSRDFIGLEKLAFVRYFSVLTGAPSNFWSINLIAANNNANPVIAQNVLMASSITINNMCSGYGAFINAHSTATIGNVRGASTYGLSLAGNNAIITLTGEINGSTTYGVQQVAFSDSNNILIGGTLKNNVTADLYGALVTDLKNYCLGVTLASSTIVSTMSPAMAGFGGWVSHKENGTANNHVQRLANGTIQSETSVRHTASGISWKVSPTTTAYVNSANPMPLSIAKIACSASGQVTASVWMRRTNTGLTARLICKGGQISGVSSNVSTSMTVAADTWEQITITFTPTEIGVVELLAECWGGTTYSLYVDDFSASQA